MCNVVLPLLNLSVALVLYVCLEKQSAGEIIAKKKYQFDSPETAPKCLNGLTTLHIITVK